MEWKRCVLRCPLWGRVHHAIGMINALVILSVQRESAPRLRVRAGVDSLIAEIDRQALAYIYFEILDGVGCIRHIVVDRGVRGRGIGRRLIDGGA